MYNVKKAVHLSFICIFILIPAALAQESDFSYIDEQIDKHFEQTRIEARRAFLGVLSYPRDVREAMLEVATRPELVVKLVITREQKLGESLIQRNAVLEPYPEEVQKAAKLLLFFPDVLGVMQEHLVMTGLMGAVYSDDKARIKEIVNEIAEAVKQEHEAAIDIWTERLQENPEAAEQLIAAAKAYAAQTEPNQAAEETNIDVSEDGEVEVSDLPSSDFVMYTLENADEYPYLSEEFLDYYDDFYDDDYDIWYSPAYARAAHRAYHRRDDIRDAARDYLIERPHMLPSALSNDFDQRIEQIRAQGKLDKAFEQTRQLQPNMTRDRFIRESANSFPRVAKLANDHQVRTKDARSRIRHQHKQARARKSSPTRRTTSQRANVKRVPTTRKQHVSRAQRQHRKSWSPSRATPKSSSAPRRSTGGARRK